MEFVGGVGAEVLVWVAAVSGVESDDREVGAALGANGLVDRAAGGVVAGLVGVEHEGDFFDVGSVELVEQAVALTS